MQVPYLDTLVPVVDDPGDLLERLRRRRLTDGGVTVDPGPLDEATLNLIRRVLSETDQDLTVALPQGRHDVAVALGVLLQLNRLGARLRGQFDGEGFEGPVVVVGLNVNLTERLRRLKIGAENLSEAMCAQRVRADGTVTDLRGTISPARAWGDGLLYLNTSLGWPPLPGVTPGLVIIDRTSFRNPDTLDAALAWADAHQTRRVVVLTVVGDPSSPALGDSTRWLRWGWTPGLRHDVGHELGRPSDCGPLSTNALLLGGGRPLALAEYQAPALSRLRRQCLSNIMAARRTNLPFPRRITEAVQLLNLLNGTWGKLETADLHAAQDPRGVSGTTLRRMLSERRDSELPAERRGFQETRWPDLRRDLLNLADLIEEYNPRFEMLLAIIDWARDHRPGTRLVVRTQSRSAACALRADLINESPPLASSLEPTHGTTPDIVVASYGERLPWARQTTLEVHLGVPPPWRRACLMGGEATEHMLVVDADEKKFAHRVAKEMNDEWQAVLERAAEELNFDQPTGPQLSVPHTVYGPVALDSRGEDVEEDTALPAIDLDRMFVAFGSALAAVDRGEEDLGTDSRTPAGARTVLARPVTLEPGDTQYWLPADTTAEVLVGNRYGTTPATKLTAGMVLVIPRGETRDQLYDRLLQAAHREADVAAVTMMLDRLRTATRELYHQCGSWEDVVRELRRRGSHVQSAQTAKSWADGTVIAPDDIEDIRRVAWLTKRHDLTMDDTWAHIGIIAAELRRLHRELGRVLSGAIGEAARGRPGENLRKLSELCDGVDLAEVLEEFELRRIQHVGPAVKVPANQLRKVLANTSRTTEGDYR